MQAALTLFKNAPYVLICFSMAFEGGFLTIIATYIVKYRNALKPNSPHFCRKFCLLFIRLFGQPNLKHDFKAREAKKCSAYPQLMQQFTQEKIHNNIFCIRLPSFVIWHLLITRPSEGWYQMTIKIPSFNSFYPTRGGRLLGYPIPRKKSQSRDIEIPWVLSESREYWSKSGSVWAFWDAPQKCWDVRK